MNLIRTPEVVRVLDDRFYFLGHDAEGNPINYPSVTRILDMYPRGFGFEQWLKDVGHNASVVAARAAESGTVVHQAIAALLRGITVRFDDRLMDEELRYHDNKYTLEEWQGILRFVDFWKTWNPVMLANETVVVNHQYQYAGTCDLICTINDSTWLIDFKFGNGVYPSYSLQVAAYAEAVNMKIDHIGILWLKAATRGADRAGKKIQGEGWQLIEPARSQQELFEMFLHVKAIYDFENSDTPKVREMPMELSLYL